MKQETLDRLHACQIELLDTVHAFCLDRGLRYYLICGTLLGAVRHKGFIPWDDDVDICMPREDYDILLKEFQSYLNGKYADKYFLQTAYTDRGYGREYAKLRMNNTIFLEKNDATVENRHHGIFLDIFPLDRSKQTPSKTARLKQKASRFIDSYIVCRRGGIKPKGIRNVLRLMPMRFLLKTRDRLNRGKGDCYSWVFFGTIAIDRFDQPVLLSFEGKEYLAPRDYDLVLTKTYGDYMTLPPPDKRVTHNPLRISFDLSGEDAEM